MTRREKQLYNALILSNRLLRGLLGGLVPERSTVNRYMVNERVLRHNCPTCEVIDNA